MNTEKLYYSCKKCGKLLDILKNELVLLDNFNYNNKTEHIILFSDKLNKCKKQHCLERNEYRVEGIYKGYNIKVYVLEKDLKFKVETDIFYLSSNYKLGLFVNKIGKTGVNFKLYEKNKEFESQFLFRTKIFIKMENSDYISDNDIIKFLSKKM